MATDIIWEKNQKRFGASVDDLTMKPCTNFSSSIFFLDWPSKLNGSVLKVRKKSKQKEMRESRELYN